MSKVNSTDVSKIMDTYFNDFIVSKVKEAIVEAPEDFYLNQYLAVYYFIRGQQIKGAKDLKQHSLKNVTELYVEVAKIIKL